LNRLCQSINIDVISSKEFDHPTAAKFRPGLEAIKVFSRGIIFSFDEGGVGHMCPAAEITVSSNILTVFCFLPSVLMSDMRCCLGDKTVAVKAS
jgi:hypothetical protein